MSKNRRRKGRKRTNMNILRKISVVLTFIFVFTFTLAGCGQSDNHNREQDNNSSQTENQSSQNTDNMLKSTTDNKNNSNDNTSNNTIVVKELEVQFGDDGTPFIMHMYDNDTAEAIVRHVGTANWRLPIYHYDDYDNWEVMQYYDIPSRYDIPSNPETITSEKAGEVYYSDPNRIVLFYKDADVSGEYTKVGYFDFTEEFQSAVENNPTVPGWSNKLVLINSMN